MVFLMVVGMLFVPTLAKAGTIQAEAAKSQSQSFQSSFFIASSDSVTTENSITIKRMEWLKGESDSIILNLDRPIRSIFISSSCSTFAGITECKATAIKHHLVRILEDIPGVRVAVADIDKKTILIILKDKNSFTPLLFWEISLAIMKHFGVDFIRFDIDK